MHGATYLLVVFEPERYQSPMKNPKLIDAGQWGLLKEEWANLVELDEVLYDVTQRRSFGIESLGTWVYVLVIDVKKHIEK